MVEADDQWGASPKCFIYIMNITPMERGSVQGKSRNYSLLDDDVLDIAKLTTFFKHKLKRAPITNSLSERVQYL